MYSLSTFLKPITNSDTTVQIRTQDLIVKYTISPYTVKTVIVSNNLLKVSLNSNRDIVLDFSTKLEAVQAGVLIESAFETLREKPPLFIDKVVKEYVNDIVSTGTFSVKSSANPTSTTNTTGVMMGLAGSITPVRSGSVLVIITGYGDNDTNQRGGTIGLRYGTGDAPANAAALTGTLATSITYLNSDLAQLFPFTLQYIIDGLVKNTAYWVDVSLAASGGAGTARIRNTDVSIIEL